MVKYITVFVKFDTYSAAVKVNVFAPDVTSAVIIVPQTVVFDELLLFLIFVYLSGQCYI